MAFLLSIAPEKGTLGAHKKKRSGIIYVTYMVVTPLLTPYIQIVANLAVLGVS